MQRFPRKPYVRTSAAQREEPLPRPKHLCVRQSSENASSGFAVAATPSNFELCAGRREGNQQPKDMMSPVALAARMTCGRTQPARLELMDTRLFQFDGDEAAEPYDELRPRRGLQAMLHGNPPALVFILDTFTWRWQPRADVVDIVENSQTQQWQLGDVRTVPTLLLTRPRFGIYGR